MLFDNLGNPRGEISPNDVISAERIEEINGEHALELTTIQVLDKYDRLIYQDGRGIWREYVVSGVDEEHASGRRIIGTYYCVWSIQPDMMGVIVSKMPGVRNPVPAGTALSELLSEQSRWAVGTVTQTTSGGASMYDQSAWKALGTLLDTWGGELDATIGVDKRGVISRKVDLYNAQGTHAAKRRFDFGADLTSVKRTYADEPFYCRVSPRGKGEETEGGGYGRKIRITSVNNGKDYLEYTPMVNIAKLPDGNGGWQYPTKIIENGDCTTPQQLKDWALSVYADELTPKITYDGDVIQAGIEGVDFSGVSLGDTVQIVDAKFPGGLRLTGRVVSMTVDELSERNISVRIGYLDKTIADKFSNLSQMASAAYNQAIELANSLSTAEYVSALLERINAEINATGGYTYITEGQGIRTYDKAVTDPLVGAEADAVVEIKGGTIRIANSRTAQGEWDWKTVFTSGHIAADMVTAAHLTAGYIGSPSGNYWNLDTGELQMANTASFIDKDGNPIPVDDLIDAASDVSELTDEIAEANAQAAAANAKISALSVGGTNLLTGTNRLKEIATNPTWESLAWGGTSTGNGSRKVVDVSGAPNNAIKRGFYIQGNNKQNDVQQKAVPLTPGNDYVLSVYAKATSTASKLYMAVGNGTTWKAAAVSASTSWQRYYLKFQGDIDGADITEGKTTVVFGNHGTSGYLTICGMKLERGTTATDWSENPFDNDQRAVDAATSALDQAKTYTNAISEKDREYTTAQRKALDESLNQSQIFKRLTNNGKTQGIYLKNGKVYINGSYIASGTIDAGIVKAGILADKKGWNKWNLATGYLKTKNMEATNANIHGQITAGADKGTKLALQDGRLDGYHKDSKGKTRVGYISPTAKVWDKNKKKYVYGIQLQSQGILRISAPTIGVSATSDTSKTTYGGFTGKITLRNLAYNMNSSMSRCNTGTVSFNFINGMLISCGKPGGM